MAEKTEKYDYLIVGAGLFGAVFARMAMDAGKRVLVLDKRGHIGGNCYTECREGIDVHRYGAHIFHTDNEEVWTFVNRYAEFNRFTNSPIANYKGELFSLPFNMYTFYKMWGCTTPQQAERIIAEQRAARGIIEPRNLEEQAISLVGTDIYEKLIRHYTEKQWGRPCSELPAFIIRRLPVRYSFDNNYFNARYQGIPTAGYTALIARLLDGAEIRLEIDYLQDRERWNSVADRVLYTGPVDAYFNYSAGVLEYRTVQFETEVLDTPNYQGNAVINYTDAETPWTRIIEHKWFNPVACDKTIISREFSTAWKPGMEPYYPVNDEKNSRLYAKYAAMAESEPRILFGGRLAEYRYYDMDVTIAAALAKAKKELGL